MSYTLENKCFECKRSEKCIDNEIISGAIQTIHSVAYGKGHIGAGTITMVCCNFKDKNTESNVVTP